jgi:hypothetical protein
MAAECGANREAVMLRYISMVSAISNKKQQRRGSSATALLMAYFLPAPLGSLK